MSGKQRSDSADAPIVHPGQCRACQHWTHPRQARGDRTAGRCRNQDSPHAGMPRLGWMGCALHEPRHRKEAET